MSVSSYGTSARRGRFVFSGGIRRHPKGIGHGFISHPSLSRPRQCHADAGHRARARRAMCAAPGSRHSARCAARPSGARRRSATRIRSSSRCRTPARPNGTARTPPGSSSSSCCCRICRATASFDKQFAYLFNSYYVAAGPRHARPQRGLVTRPASSEVAAYRAHVDEAVVRLLDEADATQLAEVLRILEIGLNHEQQHQELLLTDILHAFSLNPIAPAYDAGSVAAGAEEIRGGLRRQCRRGCTPSASPATATASTTKGPRIRSICGRCGSRARSSPMRSGSISSPTAATRRRRCGSPTAGRRCRRKAGRRPATGARSTASRTRSRSRACGRSIRPRRSAM